MDERPFMPELPIVAIVLGNDANKWIKINRVKTGNPEDVPLLPIPEAIIEKYKDHKYCKLLIDCSR
jgi:hypothetical protein